MTAPPRAPGELAEIERRAFAESMRAWGENDPNPEWFAGDCLSIVLMDCGRAGAMIDTLLDEIAALRASGDGAEAMRWLPITTAPMTMDPILVTGWVFADDDWNSGYVGYWRDAPAHKAKERYQCIGYMVQPASGHRCVEHRNGPVNVTHWMPLPAPPAQGMEALAAETEGLGAKPDSPVGSADAPSPHPDTLTKAGGPTDA